ncbi:MAG: hypothetical protein JNL47_00245, partial [Bacteroidia bacterium]|nr:hypothetical protein [Bacteroidia bacterium]
MNHFDLNTKSVLNDKPELFSVIKNLLPAWEQKTYQGKIEFWKTEAFVHFTNKVSSIGHDVFCGGYTALKTKKKGEPEKISISILPSNNDELLQYLEFFRNEIEKPESKLHRYSLTARVNEFEYKLKEGKNNPLKRVNEAIAILENNIEKKLHEKFVYPYADLSERIMNIGEIHNPYEYMPTIYRSLVLQPCYSAGFNHVWNGEELKFQSFAPYFHLNGQPDLSHVNFIELHFGMLDADYLHYLENRKEEIMEDKLLVSTLPKLGWKNTQKKGGGLTEISELLFALVRSERILLNHHPVKLDDL